MNNKQIGKLGQGNDSRECEILGNLVNFKY